MEGSLNKKEQIVWYRWPLHLLRRLYDWVLGWGNSKYSVMALFILAFAESSFFPIPPDVLLIAMALGVSTRAFYYAGLCSVGSVVGGLFGYAIGFYIWKAVNPIFIPHIFSQELFDVVQHKYALHSFWIIFAAAFTPIPYKIFTIAAGVCHVNIFGFIIASIVGRSMRFFLVATCIYFFGKKAKDFISKYFDLLTLVFLALIILGFIVTKKLL